MAHGILLRRAARQADAVLAEGPLGEAGAVEPGAGRGACAAVTAALLGQAGAHHIKAEGGRQLGQALQTGFHFQVVQGGKFWNIRGLGRRLGQAGQA
jgi:hypothetical protein